jgi:tRNA G37 N-methylase Trm5
MQVVKQRIRAKDMDPEMIEMIKRNMPKNGWCEKQLLNIHLI